MIPKEAWCYKSSSSYLMISSHVRVEFSHSDGLSNSAVNPWTVSGFLQKYKLYWINAFEGFEEVFNIFINSLTGIGGNGRIWVFEN